MTIKYNNVYLNETVTITGPYEAKGSLKSYFDKTYDDLYFGKQTWEEAESWLIKEGIELLLNKINKKESDIDVMIGGDLLNQLSACNYAVKDILAPFIGVYAACATSVLSLIIGANMIEGNQAKNIIVTASSHNNSAEKQFRYPVEYGASKPKRSTFTTTASASAIISNQESQIKIESATIGQVVDSRTDDVFNMGAVMTPAAGTTINKHLSDMSRTIDYYDLVLTGDLGIYGKKILKKYMKKEYDIDLNKYEDAGTLLYNLKSQPVNAGASGPACLPLVTYSYVINQMRKGKIKKVLLVATGSLHSQVTANQKRSLPAIAHAISLEVIL